VPQIEAALIHVPDVGRLPGRHQLLDVVEVALHRILVDGVQPRVLGELAGADGHFRVTTQEALEPTAIARLAVQANGGSDAGRHDLHVADLDALSDVSLVLDPFCHGGFHLAREDGLATVGRSVGVAGGEPLVQRRLRNA
jgi:hypothetical protein